MCGKGAVRLVVCGERVGEDELKMKCDCGGGGKVGRWAGVIYRKSLCTTFGMTGTSLSSHSLP